MLIFCDIARNHGTHTGMLLNYPCPMFEAGSARGCWISVYGSGFQAMGFGLVLGVVGLGIMKQSAMTMICGVSH